MSDQAGPPPGGEQLQLPSAPELVLSTAQLAISLAAAAISQRQELEQAQLAIDTADALLPLVARLLPEEQLRQFRRAVAELQLAYAEAVRPAPAEQQPEANPQPEPKVETPPRPRIWTPGGDV
ncbi:MAG TPA: hypothetical protein VFH74_13205 [Gaiellales bacterium]|nr:hypothetical protein [Gaiellales bacterium]